MKTEPTKTHYRQELFPTAGFGSVAPPWIKADLLQRELSHKPKTAPVNTPFHWLRRQLGWHPN